MKFIFMPMQNEFDEYFMRISFSQHNDHLPSIQVSAMAVVLVFFLIFFRIDGILPLPCY